MTIEDRQVRVKLHDKIEALRLAAKVLKERVELEAPSLVPPSFFEALVPGDLSKLPPKYRALAAAGEAGEVLEGEAERVELEPVEAGRSPASTCRASSRRPSRAT